MEPPFAVLHTPPFVHTQAAWSPFFDNRLAIATAANYGLVGNGKLQVASLVGGGAVPVRGQIDKCFDTQDALFDLAWSESHENQIVTASGDGSIRLWDITLDHPIRMWREHTKEVYSVDWSNINKTTFCSGSWDGFIRLWTPDRPHSIQAIPAHKTCIYQALFSPHEPDVIASCSTDGTVRIFDLRAPSHLPHPMAPALTIQAHATEVLSFDWNKYQPHVLATGSVDKLIRVWDCRMVKVGAATGPQVGGTNLRELQGHEYAVRKVQWSNYSGDLLASASYDMTCRVWNTNLQPGLPNLVAIHDKHAEFVVGCAWSLSDPAVIASSSWDCRTHIWRWQ